MLRSYWLSIIKVAGLSLLLFAGYTLFSTLSWHSTSLENEAAQRTKIHGQNAENRIERVCYSPLAKPDCVDEARQAQRENEREEQDLAAQKVTAWWTKVMGLAALIGMALSAVGVWLVKTTFDEAREANEIARKSSVSQNRGWLIVETIETELFLKRSGPKIEIAGTIWFVIKNTGRSACSEIWTRCAVGGHQGIWTTLFNSAQFPLANECLPPDGLMRASEDVVIEIQIENGGWKVSPQAACIEICYHGGGPDGFVTECIWTLSNWSTDSSLGWISRDYDNVASEHPRIDAYPHFGYFRTVT
jgi:hypothetical protein